jgi:hypothetical protein
MSRAWLFFVQVAEQTGSAEEILQHKFVFCLGLDYNNQAMRQLLLFFIVLQFMDLTIITEKKLS